MQSAQTYRALAALQQFVGNPVGRWQRVNRCSRACLLALVGALSSHASLAEGSARAGITVHGEWTLTLLDEQGQVEHKIEFRNALTGAGEYFLQQLMTGKVTLGSTAAGAPQWAIDFDGDGLVSTDPCFRERGFLGLVITDSAPHFASVIPSSGDNSINLTRTLSVSDACVSGATYSIKSVRTGLSYVKKEDGSTVSTRLTEKVLASPVSVRPRQAVVLDVKISFE